jgi:hypothetical protein
MGEEIDASSRTSSNHFADEAGTYGGGGHEDEQDDEDDEVVDDEEVYVCLDAGICGRPNTASPRKLLIQKG